MNEFEHVCLRVVPASQPGLVCDVSVALFDAGRVAGVDPEYPRLWRCLLGSITLLDSELGLSVSALATRTGPSLCLWFVLQ